MVVVRHGPDVPPVRRGGLGGLADVQPFLDVHAILLQNDVDVRIHPERSLRKRLGRLRKELGRRRGTRDDDRSRMYGELRVGGRIELCRVQRKDAVDGQPQLG